jgi:hypothetical protein
MPWDVQAVFCRRRHQPRRPPLAKIRPGRPAPAMGPGALHNELDIVDADEKWILNQDTDASGARDIFKHKVV